MRKINKGFTLSELLLAMTIIGIVGASVIPSVVSNAQKNQTGAVLAKSIEQLQLGFQNVMHTANDNSLSGNMSETLAAISPVELYNEVDANINNAGQSVIAHNNVKDIAPYLGLVEADSDEIEPIKSFSGATNSTYQSYIRNAHIFKFSTSPSGVAIQGWNTLINGNISYLGDPNARVGIAYIDTNGFNKSPNALGKDIFVFEIRNNGILVPKGLDDYKSTCTKGQTVGDGSSCTARIVKDNFRVTYY